MPNHVTTVISTSKEVIDSFVDVNGNVDFETVLPQPKDVKDSPSLLSLTYAGPNWYDWNNRNWGTKWNAYDTSRISDTSIKFNTAWASPDPVLVALSRKFPDEIIHVSYADEDLGYNLGKYRLTNGEQFDTVDFIVGSDEANDFAANIKYGASYAEVTKDWD